MDRCLDRYGGLVWSLCRRFDPSYAEDAAQEIFIDLWRNAGRYRQGAGSELAFISTLARRRLIDRRRKAARAPHFDLLKNVELADRRRAPQDWQILNEQAAQLKQCWDKLEERDRGLLNLSVHEGASQSQIAQQTKTPLGTVKSIIRRALMQLRDCMNRGLNQSIDGGPKP